MLIPIWRLPSPYHINTWGTDEQLTKDLVSYCLQHGLVKMLPLTNLRHEDTMLHGMRIAFFILNNWTDPIEVVVQVTDKGEEYLHVAEGCHRVAAALYMNRDEILAIRTEELERFMGKVGML